MVFTGSIFGGDAKTEIDGVVMRWSDEDKVVINGVECTSELSSDKKTATFTGAVIPDDEYEAYYPSNLKINEKLILPAVQTYNGDILSGVNPMYARSTTTDLYFHNICAIMKLVVSGTGVVETIVVTADQPLSGEFEIQGSAANGYYARLTQPSSTNAVALILDCGETGVELNGTKIFYVAVPQGEYTNLQFKLCGNCGGTWTSAPVSMKFNAGSMYTKELKNAAVTVPEPISGVFSVSDDKKVLFSRGNLQATYNGSKYVWGFAANQWDYVGGNETGGSNPETGNNWIGDEANHIGMVVDLFSWSTDAANNNWGLYMKTASTADYTYGNFKEWGENIGDGSTWYTLKDEEWKYLITEREVKGETGYGKTCIWAAVNGANGLIVFHDDYTGETSNLDYIPNGCLFLPAAGNRTGTSSGAGNYSTYWASDAFSAERAYYISSCIIYSTPTYFGHDARFRGFSVRLVRNV